MIGHNTPAPIRPGANAAAAWPSRAGDRLRYRDGRVTDMQGQPVTEVRVAAHKPAPVIRADRPAAAPGRQAPKRGAQYQPLPDSYAGRILATLRAAQGRGAVNVYLNSRASLALLRVPLNAFGGAVLACLDRGLLVRVEAGDLAAVTLPDHWVRGRAATLPQACDVPPVADVPREALA